MADFALLAQNVIDGFADETARLTRAALDENVPAAEVLQRGLLAGMDVVGQRFRAQQMFLPDVLASARAMTNAMAHLEPLLAANGGTARAGRIVIGTVKGDIHDIGKNLVAILLRGAGFEVIDLGTNVTTQGFVAAVQEHRPDMVGISAMLTTTMQQMEPIVAALAALGTPTRVLVGGAPVTRQFAARIGAHGYGRDASDAVACARALMSGPSTAGAAKLFS